MPSTIISPSILASDFTSLGSECHDVISKGADWLHVDIMDGHFVPNISIGVPVAASLRKALPNAFLDCHLMVSHPWKWAGDFHKAGANMFTFHIEAFEGYESDQDGSFQKLVQFCKDIKEKYQGMKVGIAVKPKTPVDEENNKKLNELLTMSPGLVDMVLVMTVEPGFGGQSFMGDMMPKVQFLRAKYPSLDIQVDGGIDAKTAPIAAKAGANVFVAGTAVFKAEDRADVMQKIRNSKL